jgi:hypothetical protein
MFGGNRYCMLKVAEEGDIAYAGRATAKV